MAKHISEMDVRQFLLKNLYRDEAGKFAWRINLPVLEKSVENIGEPLDPNARIEVPTIFIKGANSKYISEVDEEEIKTMFLNSRLVSVSGAGHWVQAEKPDEFAGIVNQFLLNG